MLAASLQKITELLAADLANPASQPAWLSPFEWRIARAVSAMHGISSLLHDQSRGRGPESWQRFLVEQHRQSLLRHEGITVLLRSIDAQASAGGLKLVALKGAALYALKLYEPGARPMGDIDLLVDPRDIADCAAVLARCGYEPAVHIHRHWVFQPTTAQLREESRCFGEHIDNPVKIELHTQIAEQLPIETADITDLMFASGAQPGINAYSSPAALMLHLLLHAAGNMRARALRLIQLHDIQLLAARFDVRDWQAFLDAVQRRRIWWALPPLDLGARYYPGSVPEHILFDLQAQCPNSLVRRMRRQNLTSVSWSNIRIEAFPGIEWSRSAVERIRFMKSRIYPSSRARAELHLGAEQIPNSGTIPWYGVSHAERIARWVVGRPPRVQTMLAVRAALHQEE